MINIDCRLANNSGIGRYIQSIVPRLSEYIDSNFLLFVNKDTELNFKLEDQYSLSILKSRYYSIYEQVELPAALSKHNPIWIPHYNYPLLSSAPKVVTVHDMAHLALREMIGGFLKDLYASFMFKMLPKKVEQIISVSQFTKDELIKYTNIEPDKIQVVHNGLDSFWYNVPKKENSKDKPYLLYVGNVKPHKNLRTLVKAFLDIRDKIPHNLVLVGKKNGFITIDQEIDQLVEKAPDRIEFTGFISDEQLKQYYTYADAMVFPSLYEGFGYPPLEAMACGTPVIASNAASIPEVCGNAASYFEPTNVDELVFKIEEVLTSNQLKQELMQKGKGQAKKFTIENCVEQTGVVLNKFL